jgi:hypothetical protein
MSSKSSAFALHIARNLQNRYNSSRFRSHSVKSISQVDKQLRPYSKMRQLLVLIPYRRVPIAGVLHGVLPGQVRLPREEPRELWTSRGATCYPVKYPGNSLVREVSPGTLPGSERDSHTDTQFRPFSKGKRSSDDGVDGLRSACHKSEPLRYIRAQKVVKRHPVKLYIFF